MRIAIVCSAGSWLQPAVEKLRDFWERQEHLTSIFSSTESVPEGTDLCFLLGCYEIAKEHVLKRSSHTLVVHESALPRGRGWSPLTWQVLEGQRTIPVVLFEASYGVDEGPIYIEDKIELCGHELIQELRNMQENVTIRLCQQFVSSYPGILSFARPQMGSATFYPRRRPVDSRIDPERSLADQFDLLRVVDNRRYPAYFDYRGQRYILHIYRDSDNIKDDCNEG